MPKFKVSGEYRAEFKDVVVEADDEESAAEMIESSSSIDYGDNVTLEYTDIFDVSLIEESRMAKLSVAVKDISIDLAADDDAMDYVMRSIAKQLRADAKLSASVARYPEDEEITKLLRRTANDLDEARKVFYRAERLHD